MEKYPNYVCYHEAGHCLAAWLFGHIHERCIAIVYNPSEDGAAGALKFSGPIYCEYYLFGQKTLGLRYKTRRSTNIRLEMELIYCLAGTASEAKYTKKYFEKLFKADHNLVSGSDYEHCYDIIKILSRREHFDNGLERAVFYYACFDFGTKCAQAIVSSPQGISAINEMSCILHKKGILKGNGGSQPSTDKWDPLWQLKSRRTIDLLRSGCLP